MAGTRGRLAAQRCLQTKNFKKHNLQKWDLYSSISNSFRDMSNSLNPPVCHVVKIRFEISVCERKKFQAKKWISAPKISKKHNLQKWDLYSSISNSFRDMSNSSNSPISHVVKIRWEIRVCARKKFQEKKWISASKTSKKHNLQKWDL